MWKSTAKNPGFVSIGLEMLSAPNILMIGSEGRNSGKTLFACRLVEKVAREHAIVAAKVTPIQARDGLCPRGGQGCGVCASLEGRYEITEELVADSRKDTQRLLAARARKVYWLRVMRENLEEGAAALLQVIGDGTPAVVESNTLRLVVEPGLFLMFRHRDAAPAKASARSVETYVDRFVRFDGFNFDLELTGVSLRGGEWALA